MVQTLILITAAATYFLDCITFIERYVSEETYNHYYIYVRDKLLPLFFCNDFREIKQEFRIVDTNLNLNIILALLQYTHTRILYINCIIQCMIGKVKNNHWIS